MAGGRGSKGRHRQVHWVHAHLLAAKTHSQRQAGRQAKVAKWQSQATAASVVANTKCLKYLCALTYAAFFVLLSFPFCWCCYCCCCCCWSCNSFVLVFAARPSTRTAIGARLSPPAAAARCSLPRHASRRAPLLCSLSWACPNDRVACHGMAWHGVATLSAAKHTSAHSLRSLCSFFLSPPQRETGTSRASSRAQPSGGTQPNAAKARRVSAQSTEAN